MSARTANIARAEDLTSKKRTSEAALVLLDYAKDVREAVIALVEGSHFSEARRVVSLIIGLALLILVYGGSRRTVNLAGAASPAGAC